MNVFIFMAVLIFFSLVTIGLSLYPKDTSYARRQYERSNAEILKLAIK